MKSIARSALIAGAALTIALPATSLAEPAQGAPPAKAERMMKRNHDPQAHAQRLRDTLQLRSDQEPALQAFLAAMKPPEGLRERMRAERQAAKDMTTPQLLDRRAERMAERQAAFAKRADVTKRFYAALSPSQQKAFDAMHKARMGKMGRQHRGGWGR